MAAGVAAIMFPHALKAAADREQYFCRAHTVGVDTETAGRALDDVEAELAAYVPHFGVRWPDAREIAYRRLLEPSGARPSDELRDAARKHLTACGTPLHPETVDEVARWIDSLQVPKPRGLTAEEAVRVVADLAGRAGRSARLGP